MSIINPFAPQPQPVTELGQFRLLSPSAGVRVSPICLGTMSIGESWAAGMGGGVSEEEAFEFLDKYWRAGGNFVDTSNNYQNGESEELLGKWMLARNNRDQMIVATKYSIGYLRHRDDILHMVNYQGNHKKSLMLSIRDSLEKLQTDYVDILYVHWWDYSTSIPEVMQGLDALVKSHKVLYLGISDTPAWIVVKANEYARAHGFAQFVVYQGRWNIGSRDIEREIIPMCRAEGMGIAPWGVLGQGKYKSSSEAKERSSTLRYNAPQTEEDKKISEALIKVAKDHGDNVSLAAVAVAWALSKVPYVFPIIGGRSPTQLEEVIQGLSITLTEGQKQILENCKVFEPGFPYSLFGLDPAATDGRPGYMVNAAGWVKYVKHPQPIEPGA